MNVRLENAEIFGSVLSGEGGYVGVAADDPAEVLLVSLNCPLPLLRFHPPSLLVCCFFVFAEMGATSTASGQLEVNLLLSEKRFVEGNIG